MAAGLRLGVDVLQCSRCQGKMRLIAPAPTTLQAFVFTDAAFNVEVGSNDEYTAIFSSGEPGTFRVLFRFSLDGGLNWTACDVGGAGSNGDLDLEFPNAGTVIVTP
jgi:hypothetical protein